MNRIDIDRLLRDHLRGVHEELAALMRDTRQRLEAHLRNIHGELEALMRGTERALDNHIARTEAALGDERVTDTDEQRASNDPDAEHRLRCAERRWSQRGKGQGSS